MKNSFTEKDYDAVVEFLNHIANKAEFKHTVKESIMFVKLLNNMQTNILPKIKDNILEIQAISKAKEQKDNSEEL